MCGCEVNTKKPPGRLNPVPTREGNRIPTQNHRPKASAPWGTPPPGRPHILASSRLTGGGPPNPREGPWSSSLESLRGEVCPPGDLLPRLLQPVDGVALQGREDGVEGGEVLEDPALLGGKGTGREGAQPACSGFDPSWGGAPSRKRRMPREVPLGLREERPPPQGEGLNSILGWVAGPWRACIPWPPRSSAPPPWPGGGLTRSGPRGRW